MKLIYSPKYEINLGSHVFRMEKYRQVVEQLLKTGAITHADILEPTPAHDADILLVHTPEYVEKLKTGTLSPEEAVNLEIPYSTPLIEAVWLGMGGAILTNHVALEEGLGIHVGGGFHHSYPDHGEGFCVLNDIAIGIRKLQQEKKIQKALVVDCDLHQGNGTAKIFSGDDSVFTFSIHQENNYPRIKEKSDLDIGLPDGTGDAAYLAELEQHLPKIIDSFRPDFILYDAGADPYEHDQLGAIKLTLEGLKARDRFCLSQAMRRRIPVAIVLGGGYAPTLEETVTIHTHTILTALASSVPLTPS